MLVPLRLRVFLPALLRLDGFGELLHEPIHAVGGLLRPFGVFFRRQPPFRRGDREFVICALNDDAPVRLAEPFEVKAVRPARRRLAPAFRPVEKLLHRHGRHANFARRGQIPNRAGLLQGNVFGIFVHHPLSRIGELEQTPGEVRMRVAAKFQT